MSDFDDFFKAEYSEELREDEERYQYEKANGIKHIIHIEGDGEQDEDMPEMEVGEGDDYE